MNNLFSSFNLPNFEFKVNSEYVYNFYDKLETTRDDTRFKFVEKNSSSYCHIKLKYQTLYTKKILGPYLNNFDLTSIKELSYLEDLNERKKYFNLPFNKSKVSINYSVDNSHIEKIKSEFKLTEDFGNQVYQNLSTNKKINISKKYTSNFIEGNEYNNNFFSKDNKFKLGFIDNFHNFEELKKFKLISSFKSFYSKSSYNFKNNSTLNVGFLIEKYNNENLLTSKFIFNDKLEEEYLSIFSSRTFSVVNVDFQKDFRDESVKYGENYTYLIYPVYLINFPSKNNYHTTDFYLVCDNPHVSKNIECKENIRPSYPEGLRIRYNTKNSTYIEWSQPEDIQSDIKGYQIFKRNDLMSPFRLIGQIESHHSFDAYTRNDSVSSQIISSQPNNLTNYFYDNKFDPSKINIYTICAIDAHGNVSNYSIQIGVKLNSINEKLVFDTISGAGAPIQYPNLLIKRKTKFFDNDDKIVSITPAESNCKKFTLFYTPEYDAIVRDGVETKIIKEDYSFSIYKIESDSHYLDQLKIKINPS